MKYRFAVAMLVFVVSFNVLPVFADNDTPPPMSGVRPIDRNPRYRLSALHIASRNGEIDKVRSLINDGARLEARDFLERTPLHLAVMWNRLDVAKVLLDKGAEVNSRDRWGMTPLGRVLLLEEVRNMDRTAAADLLRKHGGEE